MFKRSPSTQKNGAAAVYFPVCINRMFGRDPNGPAFPSLPEAFVTLSKRAGKPLWIPPDVAGLCCSTPWKSKGYPQGHGFMAKSIAEAMVRWSDGGKIPIVVDAASCTLGLRQDIAPLLDAEAKTKYESLSIIDSIAWCRDLLPKLTIRRKLGRIAAHPTCSITHLQLAKALEQIAADSGLQVRQIGEHVRLAAKFVGKHWRPAGNRGDHRDANTASLHGFDQRAKSSVAGKKHDVIHTAGKPHRTDCKLDAHVTLDLPVAGWRR